MKKILYFLLSFFLLLGLNVSGQERTAKPLMKITIKDGKVIKAESLDTTSRNRLKIADEGREHLSSRSSTQDTINKNKAIRTPMREEGSLHQDALLRSLTNEDSSDRKIAGDSSKSQVKDLDPDVAIRTPVNEAGGFSSGKVVQSQWEKTESTKANDKDDLNSLNRNDPGQVKTVQTTQTESFPGQQSVRKGSVQPAREEPSSKIFNASSMERKKNAINDDAGKVNLESEVHPLAGWETIKTEDFEGIFPGGAWSVYAGSGSADAYWDDVNYKSNTGYWSGFCAKNGSAGVIPPANYPDNMYAWMQYGPFDLSNATDATLTFMTNFITESNYDYLHWMVSIDGTNFYGSKSSGNTNGWVSKSLDLKNVFTLGNVTGQSQVWIAFLFSSDLSNTYEGAYLDDIVLNKYTTSTALADLTMPTIGLANTNWIVGSSITADLTEQNIGGTSAGSHYTRFYLSSNTTISTSDTQLGSDVSFSSIAAGASLTRSVTFNAPEVVDGTYYVGALIDYYNAVPESDEANNTVYRNGTINSSHPVSLPDLSWTTMSLSSTTWPIGSSITATLTESNGGTASAGSHSSRLYLSNDNIITSTDTRLGSDLNYTSISAGGTQAQSGPFTVPTVTDGTYYVGAIVDYYNAVAESNETNNAAARTGTVVIPPPATTPDITVTGATLSTNNWQSGINVTASVTETNSGTGSAGAHYTRLYLSTNQTITISDTYLAELAYTAISAGGSQVKSSTFTVPAVIDGTYYFGVIADYNNAVTESNETNNAVYATAPIIYSPLPPDLLWTNMSLSTDTWVTGSTVTANLTVANNGGSVAGAHSTRIYMSVNSTISSIDVQLGSDISYGAIIAGGSETKSHTFTVPSGDGTYYVGALVDCYNAVAEGDESNNAGARNGTIIIPPNTDLTATAISVPQASWNVGSSVTVGLTEVNLGTSSAAAHVSRLYLSTNTTISASDTKLGSDLSFGSIAGNGSQTINHTFTVPSIMTATYYVGVLVDANNSVTETDETNNALYRTGTIQVYPPLIPQGLPDLEWTTLVLSADTWTIGGSITASLTEQNTGDATAGAHNSRIYLSTNDIISTSDTQLGTDLVFGAIDTVNTIVVNKTFTVPALAGGDYYIGAIVDINNAIQEKDETNNGGRRTGLVHVAGTGSDVDLACTSMSISSSAWNNNPSVTATLTVVNNSSTTAAGVQDARIYLSTNNVISASDIQLGTDLHFTSISASGTQSQSITFNAPCLTGSYYIGALVDVNNVIAETNESNNVYLHTGQITVSCATTLPNLAPTSIGLSTEQWTIGASINADVNEANTGTGNAAAHDSRLLLSDNTVISLSDRQLGSDLHFAGISAGANLTVSTTFTVPDVAIGTYYVGIMTDVNNVITETDKSDNIQYRIGQVLVGSQPTDNPEIEVTPHSVTMNEVVTGSNSPAVRNYSTGSVRKASKPASQTAEKHATNRIIVKIRSTVGANTASLNSASPDLQMLNIRYKISVIKEIGRSNRLSGAGKKGSILLLRFESDADMDSIINEFKKIDIVEYAEPDYIMTYDDEEIKPAQIPVDEFYINQWGLKNTGNAISYTGSHVGSAGSDINAEQAWNISMGSSSIIVAVIDCGVDLTHSEFTGRLVPGYDFVNTDNDPTPLAADGHGTSCAGIIAAGNDGSGVVGVAPLVKIMPLKAMENNTGSYSAITDAIYFAVDNGARVISMSLGGTGYSMTLEEAVDYAVANGVVVLAAAGNSGTDNLTTPHYPASFDNSISVGAMAPDGHRKTTTTCDGEFWWGSNYGDIDFLTPGTRIHTTDISGSGGYTSTQYMTDFNGTSSACPFAAGVAALILSVNPALTPDLVRAIMQNASVDIGTPGYDNDSGFGRLDAFAAVQAAQSGGTNLLTIKNIGTGTLTVSSVAHNKPWLSTSGYTTPFNLNSNESVVLQINIDWTLLSASETGTITIASNDQDESNVIIPVTANSLDAEFYNISVSSNPVTGGSVHGSGTYSLNQVIDLMAIPAPQHYFVNWTEAGVEVSTNTTYNFTVTGNRNLVANFARVAPVISVIASPIEGGSIAGGGSYEFGQTVALTATPSASYSFINWTENGEVVSTNVTYSFIAAGSRSLVGNFAHDPYSINGTVNPANVGTITGTGNYILNQTANLNATADLGYVFVNWKENDNVVSVNPSYIFTVVRNRNLVAYFILKDIIISATVNINEAGSVTGAGTFSYGETVNLEALPQTGYHFVSWTEGNTEVSRSAAYSFTATSDRSLQANFEINTYTINVSAKPPEGGTISGQGSYVHGQNVTVTAVKQGCYHFVKWTENNIVVSTASSYSFTANANRNLFAVFELDVYNVTLGSIIPTNSGTVTGTGSYACGTSVTLLAIPATGYHFLNWSENSAVISTNISYTFSLAANRVLTANFEINKYPISVNIDPLNCGTVTGTGTFSHGTSVTLTAVPELGYHFVKWTEAGADISTNLNYTFTATRSRSLVATFEINSYSISATTDPPGSGTITGTGSHNHFVSATLDAVAATDYFFVNWTENNTVVSSISTYTFTVSGERTLKANFDISSPLALEASAIIQTGFTAKWKASAAATSYRLDVSENSGFTSFITGYNNKDVGNVISYNVVGLNARTRYYYRVRAYNQYETSGSSNPINLTTLSNPSSVPAALTASSCNNLVTLRWEQSTGTYFQRYRIYGGITSNPSAKVDSTIAGNTNNNDVLSNLVNGQTYYFRVTAVNDDGVESAYSNQVSLKVKTGVIPKIIGKWDRDILICANLGDSIVKFQWYKNSTMIIQKSNGQYYTTNKESGNYYVETTDKDQCKNISNVIIISGAKSLTVFPNPARENISISLEDDPVGETTIRIINENGSKVREFTTDKEIGKFIREIPISDLDEGVYFIMVVVDKTNIYYSKIVVAK